MRNFELFILHFFFSVFCVSWYEVSFMSNQVIVSLEDAHGLAAEREGIGRVLYDFVAKSPLELSLHKAGNYLLMKSM